MNNQDILQRFIFENRPVRGEFVRLTDSYQSIINNHRYPPFIKKLLAETLAATVLMSAIVKFKGRLTVQFQGKGPLKLLMAQCTDQFDLRGIAQWAEDANEDELDLAFNNGVLVIMMDPDSSGKRYQGIVSWEGNSIAKSLENYFKNSEQLNTRIWLSVNETSVSGLMLQSMPTESLAVKKMKPADEDPGWEHLTILTDTITPKELSDLDTITILRRLYAEEDVRVFDQIPVQFRCTCSVEKGENALLFIGKEEAEEELKDKKKIVVTCEFCGREYIFDQVDVARIFKRGEQSSQQMH